MTANATTRRPRPQMDIDEWRDAAARGELWMYVDEHYGMDSPFRLDDREQGEHMAAMATARQNVPPITWRPVE